MTDRMPEDHCRRSEFSNVAALECLRHHPEVMVGGVGAGNAVFYYRTMPSFDHRSRTTRDGCGLILLFFEYGAPVAGVFSWWTAAMLKAGLFSPRREAPGRGAHISAALCGVTTLLVGVVGYGPLSGPFVLFVGETVALGSATHLEEPEGLDG